MQFTGGSDVCPEYYGQSRHPKAMTQKARDVEDLRIYSYALARGLFMAGICRGGQLLNVACGGSMWQHVDGHGLAGCHPAHDALLNVEISVTSTHHQMMIPAVGSIPFLVAGETTYKEAMVGRELIRYKDNLADIEGIFYPTHNVMCYQPHPEYRPGSPMEAHYFVCLNMMIERSVLIEEHRKVIEECAD